MIQEYKEYAGQGGISPSAGRGRSTPTGYSLEEGDVTGQELQFDNGYKVFAIQVRGQKAVIKGPGPWKDFVESGESVDRLVNQWLAHMQERHPNEKVVTNRGRKAGVEDVEGSQEHKYFNLPSTRRAARHVGTVDEGTREAEKVHEEGSTTEGRLDRLESMMNRLFRILSKGKAEEETPSKPKPEEAAKT